MQGRSVGRGGFFAVDAVAPGLVAQDTVFALLANYREELFGEDMWADLFAAGGRPSVPGPMMGAAMVLQALDGASDRVAAEKLTFDLRWKHAVGLGVDEEPFHFSTFCYWRSRIAASDRPDRLMGAVAQVIAESGVLQGLGKRVVDSTVLLDAVARQSTIQMLIWSISRVRVVIGELVGFIDARPGRTWYADRLRPDIDWTDQQAKDDLVSLLVNDAYAIIAKAAVVIEDLPARLGDQRPDGMSDQEFAQVLGQVKERYLDVVGMLALIAGQDVEPAEGSDGTDGRWRIASKVAPNRVISLVDPDARHARKSRAAKADGYKGHVVAEPTTGLITAATCTKAAGQEASDATAGQGMLASELPGDTVPEPEPVAEACGAVTPKGSDGVQGVYGDSAYDSTVMLAYLADAGVEAVIKARPLHTAVPGGYSIDDFTPRITPTDHGPVVTAITCPGGFTQDASPKGRVNFRPRCQECIVKDRCTTATHGRVITLGSDALMRREHRAKAATPAFAADYRQTRPMAERAIAWMTRHLRRLPYRGVTKNNAAWQTRAAAINLRRLTTMGLTRSAGTWTITPAT
jgi:transposase